MKRKLLFTLGCLVGLATLSYGIYAWYNAITYVSTDDAYVEGTISPGSTMIGVCGTKETVPAGDEDASSRTQTIPNAARFFEITPPCSCSGIQPRVRAPERT